VPSPVVVTLGPRARAEYRVVCFPWAGAGPTVFFPWLPLFPDDIELCAVRLPGREASFAEAPFQSFDEASTAVARALDDLNIKRTILFGHSIGALLAFQTAELLEINAAAPPELLVVAAAAPPRSDHNGRSMSELSDNELWTTLLARNSGIAVTVPLSIRQLLLRQLRADLALLDAPSGSTPRSLAMPIIAYAGTSDLALDRATVRDWEQFSRAGADVQWFEGGHFFLRDAAADVVRQLVLDIRHRLPSPVYRSQPCENLRQVRQLPIGER
jgi:medium-chain acyl-[acyl-carrier-protein] hydrolase